MIGKTLGHYEILEPLGAGRMGEVYRARDTKLDREVACRRLFGPTRISFGRCVRWSGALGHRPDHQRMSIPYSRHQISVNNRVLGFGIWLSVSLAACSAAPEAVDVNIADYAAAAEGGVATHVMIPEPDPGGSESLLVRGWQPVNPEDLGAGHWAVGRHAELRFLAVRSVDRILELTVSPFDAPLAGGQNLNVTLNGLGLRSIELERGPHDHEISLPGRAVRVGWNTLDLEFTYAFSPQEIDASSTDTRPLAAHFRRVAIRPAPGRLMGPGDAPEISVDRNPQAGAARVIEMPTDSMMSVWLRPRPGEVVGSLSARFQAPTDGGTIHGTLELVDETGAPHELVARTFNEAPPRPQDFSVDLSDWADQLVQLRLRVWGDTNGVVDWYGLSTTTGAAGTSSVGSRSGILVSPPRSGRLGRPDVVVVLLDAARADAFGGKGQQSLTPNVDELAAAGTRFASVWSPSSWTGQSVPAVLTGRHADSIGIETWESRLPGTVPTMAEMLAGYGYRTVLWSQHPVYEWDPGLQRGFTSFGQARGEVLGERDRLPTADELFVSDQPTFALVHLMPPHAPYGPPAPFRGSLSSWYTGDFDPTPQNLNLFFRLTQGATDAERSELTRYVRARYDENVRYADHLVGRLLQTVREAERYKDALIVVTSDHGEAMREHGGFLHMHHVFEEFIHVPLVVKWPDSADGFAPTIAEPVSLVDLAPTLIDGLGIPDESLGFQGISLLPLAFDGARPERFLYAYTSGRERERQPPRRIYALRSGDDKVMYREDQRRLYRYDLGVDAAETEDLAALTGRSAPLGRYLLQELRRLRGRNANLFLNIAGQGAIEELDEETIRRLRALGYIR